MRRSPEVYAENLANGASHIQIDMKPAQVKLLSGDIYTTRPAEKHSTCAVNSYKNKSMAPCGNQEAGVWGDDILLDVLYRDYGYFDDAVPFGLSGITAVVKHKKQNVP